jgi:hypothetical protein
VSYARRDAPVVYDLLSRLHRDGYRIWYDEGIESGGDFTDEIAAAIDNCSLFVVFVSAVSVARRMVRDETRHAYIHDKPILPIYVEETAPPSGVELIIGSAQAIMLHRKTAAAVLADVSTVLDSHGAGRVTGIGLDTKVDLSLPVAARTELPAETTSWRRSRGRKALSVSEAFTDRVPESAALLGSFDRQLARLRGVEPIEEGVFPNVLVFHGGGGVGKTGLSRRLQLWATGQLSDDGEWGPWPRDPVTAVRWDFNNSDGNVNIVTLMEALRAGVAHHAYPAFDLALAAYFEAVRPGSETGELSVKGKVADDLLRSLQRIASDLQLSIPRALVSRDVRSVRDGVLAAAGHWPLLDRHDGLAATLERCQDLSPGSADAVEVAAEVASVLTQEILGVTPAARPALIIFVDHFERLQRADVTAAEEAIVSLVISLPTVLFVVTGRDNLNWHEPHRTYLEAAGARAWPGLVPGATNDPRQHVLDRLSRQDTRRLYTAHRDTHRWHMSDELIDHLVVRSDGLPLHVDAVLKLAKNLEDHEPGRTFREADLDRELPEVVTAIMKTLSDHERDAFRAMCVLPFFDIQLAAAVARPAAERSVDAEGAVHRAVKRALVESNADRLYPYRVHDEIRELVRRDRATEGHWGEGDWKAAAERGIEEAQRRITIAHTDASDDEESHSLALAIRLAYDWGLLDTDLKKAVDRSPTIGGLAHLIPVIAGNEPDTPLVTLMRFIHAMALPYEASIAALRSVCSAGMPVSGTATLWLTYRLRVVARYDDALSCLEGFIADPPQGSSVGYAHHQYAMTLRLARRFSDALEYEEEHRPDLLPRLQGFVERDQGLLSQDPGVERAYLDRQGSSRYRFELRVQDIVRRSRQGAASLKEVLQCLEEASARRLQPERTRCLRVLGYLSLNQTDAFLDTIRRAREHVSAHGHGNTLVPELLALRALLTRNPADAQAARDSVMGPSLRGSAWIATEVFLDELGYPLPSIPTQWTIPYEEVRRNWLNIADGIIEHAKAATSP